MNEMRKVHCDGCGADITTTGNCEDYRLVLASESKAPWYIAEGLTGGVLTAMAIPDPLPQSKHFCGLGCLRAWCKSESDSDGP